MHLILTPSDSIGKKKTSCFLCQSLSQHTLKDFLILSIFAEMDFHSLLRRDLQFLCKRNKIPANMTNLAMADALKALEIVEGLNEYMNPSDSNILQSPTSVAKLPPNTATRTTRRKTAIKAEPLSSSQLVNRSCRLTSKSLDGEMDQVNMNKNVAQEPKTNNVKIEANVAKTPAARSTRKAPAGTSYSSKIQEGKKGELVQSGYSTRRSTRLLEKCMADLSLKTKETLDNLEKIEETEQKVSAQEKNPAGSEERSEEAEIIPGRDLSASMEKEWEVLKNDSDQVLGGLEVYVDIGDIAVLDANTETNKEKVNDVMGDEKESETSLVQEETLQANEAICEEGLKKNVTDQEIGDTEIYVDHGDIPVLDNTETNTDNKESKNIQAFDSLVQVEHLEIEQGIQEILSEPEKINTFDEETVMNRTDGDVETEPEEDNSGVDSDGTISEADSNQADHQETEQAIQENDSVTEKINTLDEDRMVDQTDGDTETEPEEDNSGVDSDGTISEADSNQAVQGSDIADEEMILSESEGSVTAPTSPPLLLEEAKVKSTPFSAESISVQFPRPNKSATTPSKNSAMKLVDVGNKNKENNVEMMMNVVNNNDNGESKGEVKKKKKVDEENLKDVSMRQLVKILKELSIKGNNNRTALQVLPGNSQIAE